MKTTLLATLLAIAATVSASTAQAPELAPLSSYDRKAVVDELRELATSIEWWAYYYAGTTAADPDYRGTAKGLRMAAYILEHHQPKDPTALTREQRREQTEREMLELLRGGNKEKQ